VLQAALSFVLLSVSGLLTAALHNLENQDFGFEQDRRIVVNFDPRVAGYGPEQLAPLYRRIYDSLSGIPGASAVALCIYSPLSGNNWGAGVLVDGHPAPGPNDDDFSSWDRVTAGYFSVIGNPILRGRGITEQDTSTSRHVAVINQAFARKFFKNEDPIGKYFGRDGMGARLYEIVGIAKDARYLTFWLDKPIAPFFFRLAQQHDFSPKAASTEVSPSSHFLRDIVIVTRPGASVSFGRVQEAMASGFPGTALPPAPTVCQQQLYGINQYDPMIIASAILVLGTSALTAALIPAFRASSISPLQALRA